MKDLQLNFFQMFLGSVWFCMIFQYITPIFTGTPPAPIWINYIIALLGSVGAHISIKLWEKKRKNKK